MNKIIDAFIIISVIGSFIGIVGAIAAGGGGVIGFFVIIFVLMFCLLLSRKKVLVSIIRYFRGVINEVKK